VQEDRAEFTGLLLPLALTAFYSKNPSMTFSASQVLQTVSVYLGSPIWCARVLFRSKVDGVVP